MSGLRDFLITDRTISDVERVKYLSSLWGPVPGQWHGTREELAEWSDGLKGVYNAADLNRVAMAANYLLTHLKESGYNVPDGTTPVSMISSIAVPFGSGTANGELAYTGDTVTLEAKEKGESRFLRWEENGQTVSTDKAIAVRANRDFSFMAIFWPEWAKETSIVGMGRVGTAILGQGFKTELFPDEYGKYTSVTGMGRIGTAKLGKGII